MEFKHRLKELRKKAGLSQEALAEKIDLTTRTVQNYEIGARKPKNIDIVRKMAEALGTTTETLLGTDGLLVVEAYEKGGAGAARDIDGLVSEITALFAGGEIEESEKEGIMAAISQAYWMAKEKNKKYAAKKPSADKKSE